MLWSNGVATNINAGQAYGISNAGAVVGAFASDTPNTQQPFIWQSSHTTTIGVGIGGIAKSVNSSNTVVGYYFISPYEHEPYDRAFYFQNGGVPKQLSNAGDYPGVYRVSGYDYNYAHANAINDSGTIVGNVCDHSGFDNDPGKAWPGSALALIQLTSAPV